MATYIKIFNEVLALIWRPPILDPRLKLYL